MRVRKAPYNFGKPEDVRRYHADMAAALARVNINRPYGRPLVPIPQLDDWHARTCRSYGAGGDDHGG
jgi:hypothetical protein